METDDGWPRRLDDTSWIGAVYFRKLPPWGAAPWGCCASLANGPALSGLPSNVTIDTSHHYPRLMHSPHDWEIWQGNERIWVSEQSSRVVKMAQDAAQYETLLAVFAEAEDRIF